MQSVEELLPPAPAAHPRAARVNTLKMSVEDALAWIRQPPPEHMKLTALVCPLHFAVNTTPTSPYAYCPL